MRSIRRALLVRLISGGLLLLTGAGIALDLMISRALKQEFDRGLLLSAQSLRAFVEEKNGIVRMDGDVDDILEFNRRDASSFFLLKDGTSMELKRSRSLGGQLLPSPVSFPSGHKSQSFTATLEDGRHLRCVALRFQPVVEGRMTQEPVQDVELIVARDDFPLHHSQSRIRDALAATGAATLCALAILLGWGVRRGMLPLDNLSREISEVDAGSLSSRVTPSGLPSELQPIANRLNHLLERLEKAFERERRFTDAVAHELRTPLAELLALAEVNLLAPTDTHETRSASWQEALVITRRMESLALRLLELARAGQHKWNLNPREVKIQPLLESVWERMETTAIARDIRLEIKFPETLTLSTDPILLELIINNLIGNAVRYATPRSVLLVSGDASELIFSNRTTDLAVEDATLLFERFWKKDYSRNDASRHGLGLPLAREIADLLGFRLRAEISASGMIHLILDLGKMLPEQPLLPASARYEETNQGF